VQCFIARLAEGYRRYSAAVTAPGLLAPFVPSAAEGSAVTGPTGADDERMHTLALAEAALRPYGSDARPMPRPPQVAVLGPTQTGKSTLANLLLGRRLAEVSPLAGFTVHPQGFWIGAAGGDERWAGELFPGWQRCAPDELTRDVLKSYALSHVESDVADAGGPEEAASGVARALPRCVIWDTPDFDSLAARRYERGVLEVAALADVYVLVLSREKYSDLSVWHFLELIEPLGRPLLICLNKLTPDAEEPVLRSLRERLAERGRAWGDVPIVPLPYDPTLATGGNGATIACAQQVRSALATCLDALAKADARHRDVARAAGVRTLLRRHWAAWLAPVEAEHAALAEWRGTIAAAGAQFMVAYARDYLDHPQRYDSFRRAAIGLLNLLEIPALGGLISRARRVVTWPARRLLAAGRTWWQERHRPGAPAHSLGPEATVLVDTLDGLLTGLERDVARRCRPSAPGVAVWQALDGRLQAEQTRLRAVFDAALHTHHQQVSRDIDAAAGRLYRELCKQPARLAALRTARAVIDAGSILLAVKTGGLTPLDAVWAPATFALTSLLMQGFAGLELGRAAHDLKAQQRQAVEETFVRGLLLRELNALADRLDQPGVFGITPQGVQTATNALAAWEAGDE
jgi:hypothetical protein